MLSEPNPTLTRCAFSPVAEQVLENMIVDHTAHIKSLAQFAVTLIPGTTNVLANPTVQRIQVFRKLFFHCFTVSSITELHGLATTEVFVVHLEQLFISNLLVGIIRMDTFALAEKFV